MEEDIAGLWNHIEGEDISLRVGLGVRRCKVSAVGFWVWSIQCQSEACVYQEVCKAAVNKAQSKRHHVSVGGYDSSQVLPKDSNARRSSQGLSLLQ